MDKTGLKTKLSEELTSYLINFLYLSCFFGVFALYRRLLMAEYDISYGQYGVAVFKALVLAKVMMLGDVLKLGSRLHGNPLIITALYKTLIFTIWVVLFRVLEVTAVRLLHGEPISGVVPELLHPSPYALLAHGLIVFVAFLPFFSLKALSGVFGGQTILKILYDRPRI